MSNVIPIIVLIICIRGGAALWGDARRALARVGKWYADMQVRRAGRITRGKAARDQRVQDTLWELTQIVQDQRAELATLRGMSATVSKPALPLKVVKP